MGSIDRMGNGRVRCLLVEAVWRLLRWQPGWKSAQRMKGKLAGGGALKKKTVVALAGLLEFIYPEVFGKAPPLNRDQLLMLQEDNVGEAWRAAGLFKLRALSFAEGIERYLNPDWSCADAGKE